MLEVKHLEVYGIDAAMRGLRNPLNSWDKGDTKDGVIGKEDMKLLLKLCKAGTSHRKVLRQIMVSMDIKASIAWWKDFDQYKVGTVTNSCSFMHTLHKQPLTMDDIETDGCSPSGIAVIEATVEEFNTLREKYLETGDKQYWYDILTILPYRAKQLRTWTGNYEVLVSAIQQRTGHKQKEFADFIAQVKAGCPYLCQIVEACS